MSGPGTQAPPPLQESNATARSLSMIWKRSASPWTSQWIHQLMRTSKQTWISPPFPISSPSSIEKRDRRAVWKLFDLQNLIKSLSEFLSPAEAVKCFCSESVSWMGPLYIFEIDRPLLRTSKCLSCRHTVCKIQNLVLLTVSLGGGILSLQPFLLWPSKPSGSQSLTACLKN